MKPVDCVILTPHPDIGPLLVDLLEARDIDRAIALCRLSVSGVPCRVFSRRRGMVELRAIRGTRRTFSIPAKAVREA
jgi:hypothetical protein